MTGWLVPSSDGGGAGGSVGTTHPELVDGARRLCAGAEAHDVDGLRRQVRELMEAYLDHTVLEEPLLRELPTFTARLVRSGQDRLLQDLMVLAVEIEASGAGALLEGLTRDLLLRLEAQVEAEQRAYQRCSF